VEEHEITETPEDELTEPVDGIVDAVEYVTNTAEDALIETLEDKTLEDEFTGTAHVDRIVDTVGYVTNTVDDSLIETLEDEFTGAVHMDGIIDTVIYVTNTVEDALIETLEDETLEDGLTGTVDGIVDTVGYGPTNTVTVGALIKTLEDELTGAVDRIVDTVEDELTESMDGITNTVEHLTDHEPSEHLDHMPMKLTRRRHCVYCQQHKEDWIPKKKYPKRSFGTNITNILVAPTIIDTCPTAQGKDTRGYRVSRV
jgi:hypothetical protein